MALPIAYMGFIDMPITRLMKPKMRGWSPFWKPIPPPPLINYYDEPNRFIVLPTDIVPHVLGCLELLQRPDVFTGDETQIENGLTLFSELRYLLMTGLSIVEDIRLENCDIEVLRDGEWLSIGDLSECEELTGPAGPAGPAGPPGVDGEDGQDGQDGVSIQTIIDERTETRTADEVWGACRHLVRYLEEKVLDVVAHIRIAANSSDAVANIWSAIPILGQLIPVDELLKLVKDAELIGTDLILAQITPEIKNEMACNLFCKVMENDGSLTEDIMFAWYADHVVVNILGADNIFDLLESILDPARNLGSQTIILLSWLLGYQTSKNWYWLGLNNPDADWELLCDCDAVKWTVEFLSGHGPPPGYWFDPGTNDLPVLYDAVADKFVGSKDPSRTTDSSLIMVRYVIPDAVTISHVVTYAYARNHGPLFTAPQRIILEDSEGTEVIHHVENDGKGDEIAFEVIWSGRAVGIVGFFNSAGIYQPNDGNFTEVWITKIRIEGLGVVPPLWQSYVVPNEPS